MRGMRAYQAIRALTLVLVLSSCGSHSVGAVPRGVASPVVARQATNTPTPPGRTPTMPTNGDDCANLAVTGVDRAGLPLPAGLFWQSTNADGTIARYTIAACGSALYTFYTGHLPAMGWSVLTATRQDADQYVILCQRATMKLSLLIIVYPDASGAYLIISSGV